MTAPKELRAANIDAVLETLRSHGSLSRTELAELTGLSRTTVISIVDELAGLRHVAIGDRAAPRAMGRPAAGVSLAVGAGVVLGIALGRDRVDVVVTDLSCTRLAHRGSHRAAGDVADVVVALAHDALAEAGAPLDRLLAAGAAVDAGARATLPGALGERLGVPMTVAAPARLEALAESVLGAGRGLRHLVYVHVDETLEGAVLVEGRLRTGPTGSAGAIGHVPVRADGPACACGRRGCLSSVASGEALLHALAPVHGDDLDLEALLALALHGDAAAHRALADAGQEIGAVVATLCMALNPEAVIAGGRLAADDLPLLDGIRAQLATPKLRDTGPIAVHTAVLGPIASAWGAASAAARSARPIPPAS